MHLAANLDGIPHLAKDERDARVACTRYQAAVTCAAFIEESRRKFTNANIPHRKSGVRGTRPILMAVPLLFAGATSSCSRIWPSTIDENCFSLSQRIVVWELEGRNC